MGGDIIPERLEKHKEKGGREKVKKRRRDD
jgi:hypothetical protein